MTPEPSPAPSTRPTKSSVEAEREAFLEQGMMHNVAICDLALSALSETGKPSRTDLLNVRIAAEFGFRCAEKGMNMDAMVERLNDTLDERIGSTYQILLHDSAPSN